MVSPVEHIRIEMMFDVKYSLAPPIISVTNNQQLVLQETVIEDTTIISFELELVNTVMEPGVLCVHRTNFDGVHEQLLSLRSLHLDGINLERICYQSRYRPEYPEPWISEQKAQGHDWPEYLTGAMSWGWNGVWQLHYHTPIYTWLLKNV